MQQKARVSDLRKQRDHYSGKKKKHSIKSQVVVDKCKREIVCGHFCKGRRHDCHLFKESGVHFKRSTKKINDTGYLGIQRLHANSELPKKKTKKHPLTREDKLRNQVLSSQRVLIEHVIGMLKQFKIISDKYRNRRKQFGLRCNLIAGLYNYELP